jgi:Protein of unknown function (DUF2815)
MSKAKSVIVGTPKGVFSYMWLDKPDLYKGQEKYKGTIMIPKDATGLTWVIGKERHQGTAKQFFDAILKIHKEYGGSVKTKTPIKDGDKLTDKDDNPREATQGFYVMTGKSKFKPTKLNAKGVEIPNTPIMGGDVGRLTLKLSQYDDGAATQLKSAKLLEKNATGGQQDIFGEEDGYDEDDKPSRAPRDEAEGEEAGDAGDSSEGDDDF